jgi:ribosomal protein S12 methylthiotransferase
MVLKPTVAFQSSRLREKSSRYRTYAGSAAQAGYQVDANEELADYVVVNTCSFIEAAREESVRTLVELAEANKKVVITGCLAQHFQDQLLEEIPEAVALVGTGDYQPHCRSY